MVIFACDRSTDTIRFRSTKIPGLEVVSSAYEDNVPAVSANGTLFSTRVPTHASETGGNVAPRERTWLLFDGGGGR